MSTVPRLHRPLKIFSYVVLLLMLLAMLWAAYVSLVNWPAIAV